MRQVPTHATLAFTSYLILGSGRLSRHLQAYFQFEALPFQVWSRADGPETLVSKALEASHILFALPDSQIEAFAQAHRTLFDAKSCVHFSGALVTTLMPSAHPLMTFPDDLYDRETYLHLPFVLEKGRNTFTNLLPGLKNPAFEIEPALKTRYHALCVMSGNFTVLLWEKVFREFEQSFGLPKQILLPYLLQTTENLALSKTSVLTGPLVRNDDETIKKHLVELGDDPFASIYRSFVHAYQRGGFR